MRDLVLLIIFAMFFGGCATVAEIPAEVSEPLLIRSRLTISDIVINSTVAIDLESAEIVCTGQRSVSEISMQGAVVLAHTCQEGDLKSVTLTIKDEPFLFAITRRDAVTGKHKSIAGFGALKQKGLLLPLDLNDVPRLPDWAKVDKAGG